MNEPALSSDTFELHRPRLRSIAFRMLGSIDDAEDVVQEAWIRAQRADVSDVENIAGWLTTVVARLALDALRRRAVRPVDVLDVDALVADTVAADTVVADTVVAHAVDFVTPAVDPQIELELSEAVSASLMVVLQRLRPAERVAFVLHDLFAVPFDTVGAVLGRSPAAAKQMASRARQRVRGGAARAPVDLVGQRRVVDAFLDAARGGDLDRLIVLLHPDVAIDADAAAVLMGSPAVTTGADAVAATFNGRALGARAAVIDGGVGFVWQVGDTLKVVWEVEIVNGVITHIEMLAGADVLAVLEVVVG